ncbi:MAG TPA: serine protease [Vicinamibacterales bacterium]|nr:serine protease [Vicinamibacterales bacterium]
MMRTFVALLCFCLVPVAALGQPRFVIKRSEVLARSAAVQTRDLPLTCTATSPAEIRQPVSSSGAAERVQLTFKAPVPKTGWTVSVVTSTGERWNIGAEAVAAEVEQQGANTISVWSGTVRGGGKAVVLTRNPPDAPCPAVTITGIVVETVQSKPSSVIGRNDLKPFRQQLNQGPQDMRNWALAIARIRFVSDADRLEYFCTGFLVTSRLLLTNHHCLSSNAEAASAELDFDYDVAGRTTGVQTVRVKSLVHADEARDYSLVELETPSTRTPLTLAAATFASAQPLIILQHPGGQIKHASIADCAAQAIGVPGVSDVATDFEHGCDTEGGSSGSPVQQTSNGFVVGLHHWGKVDPAQPGWNQAVKIVDVLQDLRSKLSSLSPRHAPLAPEISALIDAALARR